MQCQFRNRQKNTVFTIPFSETMELLSVFSNHRYELLSVIDLAGHSFFILLGCFGCGILQLQQFCEFRHPRVGWLWSFVAKWKQEKKKSSVKDYFEHVLNVPVP